MRGRLAGAAAAAAVLLALAPKGRAKVSPWAAAELRAATRDVLRRLSFDCRRTAIVTSLWAERPAKQCAVAPHYALTADQADFGGVLRFAAVAPPAPAPAGARSLLARLYAAGYASSEAAEAVAFLAPETPRERIVRAA